jgi:subtilisin-like proprotein convertase family protein
MSFTKSLASEPHRRLTAMLFAALAAVWIFLPPMLVAAADNGTLFVAANAPETTSEMLVFLRPGTDAAAFAAQYGLTESYGLRSDPDAYVFSASSSGLLPAALASAQADSRVRSAFENARTENTRCDFVPDDPYFKPFSVWPGQWHLSNSYTAGLDANVLGAWQQYTGQGVTIGIVDDGLETAHPDLAPNYDAADSWNFGNNTGDPNPVTADDRHGIAVAGVAAARGGNGIGVCGAAPYAGLAGLRIDYPTQTTAMFVDATLYHSSGSNTSIKVENHSYGVTTPYALSSAERAALATSTAAGTIHCFAAGNDRGTIAEDANKKDLQASPDSITVAAVGSTGKFASYSCFGANIFVTAPSTTNGGLGIITTDRTGTPGYNGFVDNNYTGSFGGTSSTTPLVCGVLALAKEAQPSLDTRFAKHLLVQTSRIVDSGDKTVTGGGDGVTSGSAWVTNAAGHAFNENYGFGLIDATALTQQAVLFSGVTPLHTFDSGILSVAAAIPDNDTAGITRSLQIAETTPLEEVLVSLNIKHTFRGNLEAYLTSPGGTTNRLMIRNSSDSSDNINWQFTSNAFWGEDPFGTWSLKIDDVAGGDTGTWNNWSLQLRMGELIPVPEPTTGAMLLIGVIAAVGIAVRRRRQSD